MTTTLTEYRAILQKELMDRFEKYPKYSLRMFGRELGLSAPRLSEILNRKQGLSPQAAQRVAKALGLNPHRSRYFCDLVAAEHARSPKARQEARLRLEQWDHESDPDLPYTLHPDSFAAIADWYHFGILQLLRCKHLEHDARWMAQRLAVPLPQIESALLRLIRLGLLQFKDGQYSLVKQNGWVSSDQPSAGVQLFQKQILEKALTAMHEQPVSSRFYCTQFLSINRSDLPKMSSALQELQKQFCSDFNGDQPNESLYCLSSQFFRLEENVE